MKFKQKAFMKKILVVDDEADILGVIKIILQSRNFIVYTVSRWQDITLAINTFKPELILLDISLGDADGRVICKELKMYGKTKNIKIILISARFGIESTLNETHADAFIAKPFEATQLVETIENTLLQQPKYP
jgi:DNA-binding response OmpR family regulator